MMGERDSASIKRKLFWLAFWWFYQETDMQSKMRAK